MQDKSKKDFSAVIDDWDKHLGSTVDHIKRSIIVTIDDIMQLTNMVKELAGTCRVKGALIK